MKELIVGVSGLNASDNPGPGIGVARSLKEDPELRVKIVGLAYDPMEPGIYLDWLIDKTFIMPYPSNGGDEFIARLLQIKESYGLDCIIPNLDAELPLYIKWADRLAEYGIRTFLPQMEQFKLRGKAHLHEIAEKISISLPQTKVVTSVDGLLAAINTINLPVMVKGSFYKAYKCHTVTEAVSHYHELVAEWGYPIIVQQVVTGDELNVVGLGDGEGNSLGLVSIKKLSVTALGKIWTGVTIKHPKMLAAVEAFIREFKWRGPFELECMVNGDEIFLIEINPRFPAWSYFATGVGINLPSRLIRRAFDLPVPPLPTYEAGRLFIRYTNELVTDMALFQRIILRGESS